MFKGKRKFCSYTPPATDSARARANACLFLVSARSLENVTAAWVAHNFRLKPLTAQVMLEKELVRRSNGPLS